MRNVRRSGSAGAVAAILLVGVFAGVVDAQQRRRAPARRPAENAVVLPVNQYFRVKMEQEVGSDTSHVGERFTASVVSPVNRGGREIVPAGSTIGGRISTVTKARSRGRDGSLGVRFDTLTLPNGARYRISASLVELTDEHGGQVDEEGVLEGKSAKRRNIYFVGGGAAGGALLGGLAGGGKGAGIGTIVGAGAGVAGALLTKGKNAKVERGTEVGVALDRAVTIRTGPVPR